MELVPSSLEQIPQPQMLELVHYSLNVQMRIKIKQLVIPDKMLVTLIKQQ